MEQLLVEIAKQVPALAVLAVLVLRFLKTQREQADAFVAALAARDGQMGAMAATATGLQRDTNVLLGKVEKALEQHGEESAKTRKVLHETQEVVARFARA